jgi:DNA-binding NtrC family response regulator
MNRRDADSSPVHVFCGIADEHADGSEHQTEPANTRDLMVPPASHQYPLQSAFGGQKPTGAEPPPGTQIAGGNGEWRKLLLLAEAVAPQLQIAAVEGEQGSGKQTLARYLHSRSPFARLRFRRCDAREWLATDATPVGFTYIDRVDLLTAREQERLLELLRAMQDIPRAGWALVVASRTPFAQLASGGMMLPDLVFRLTVVRFAIPPLVHRREDIAPLAQFLLDQLSTRYQRQRVVLGPGALARLLQHNWPGNVRELVSVLEGAMIEATDGVLRAEDLQLLSGSHARVEPKAITPPTPSLNLHSVIRKHVQYVLELNRGNKLLSSRQLGISRSTLYRILGDESVLGR